eukprot:scaffold1172_cov180-Ochromonas_danica.AAC.26
MDYTRLTPLKQDLLEAKKRLGQQDGKIILLSCQLEKKKMLAEETQSQLHQLSHEVKKKEDEIKSLYESLRKSQESLSQQHSHHHHHQLQSSSLGYTIQEVQGLRQGQGNVEGNDDKTRLDVEAFLLHINRSAGFRHLISGNDHHHHHSAHHPYHPYYHPYSSSLNLSEISTQKILTAMTNYPNLQYQQHQYSSNDNMPTNYNNNNNDNNYNNNEMFANSSKSLNNSNSNSSGSSGGSIISNSQSLSHHHYHTKKQMMATSSNVVLSEKSRSDEQKGHYHHPHHQPSRSDGMSHNDIADCPFPTNFQKKIFSPPTSSSSLLDDILPDPPVVVLSNTTKRNCSSKSSSSHVVKSLPPMKASFSNKVGQSYGMIAHEERLLDETCQSISMDDDHDDDTVLLDETLISEADLSFYSLDTTIDQSTISPLKVVRDHQSKVVSLGQYDEQPLDVKQSSMACISSNVFHEKLHAIRDENDKLRTDISRFKGQLEVGMSYYHSIVDSYLLTLV